MSQNTKLGVKDIFPLKIMEIGDSFEVRGKFAQSQVRSRIYQYGRKHKKKFCMRIIRKSPTMQTVKVWRLE